MASSNNSHYTHTGGNGNSSATLIPPAIPESPNVIIRAYNRRLPIHRLPTEALAIVFRYFTLVETCRLDPYDTVFRTITLSGVCSHWRRIVVHDAKFWTYIPIGSTMGSHKITALCFKRSQDRLINISAGLLDADPWRVEEILPLPTHRVLSLHILSNKIENVRLVMEDMLRGGAPGALRYLSIKHNLSRNRTGATFNSILSQSSPGLRESLHRLIKKLHKLRLTGVSLPPGSYSFDELRELFLERANPENVIHALTSSRHVRSIEANHLISRPEGGINPSNDPPVAVKRLKSLYLGRIQDSAALCNILESISPGPYKLEFTISVERVLMARHRSSNTPSGSSSGVSRGVDMLTPLLHKFDNITTLTLESNLHAPSQVLCEKTRTLLKHLPNLRYLILVRFCLTQPMSAAITRSFEDNSTGAFPLLGRLQLHDTHMVDYDAFKAMIFSHQIGHICISNCKLKWDGDKPTRRPTSDVKSPLYQWLSAVVSEVSIV